jgi:hypothetical protein
VGATMAHSLLAAYIDKPPFSEVMESFFDSTHQNNPVKQFFLASPQFTVLAAVDHYWLYLLTKANFKYKKPAIATAEYKAPLSENQFAEVVALINKLIPNSYIRKIIITFNPIFLFIIFVVLIEGCGNKFEECVQNQQEDYRKLNPDASYSEAARLRNSYETMCSSMKK